MARRTSDFQTIRSEGGLLPPDLLHRVLDPKESLPGTAPEDYGLPPGERPNDAITQSWNRLTRHWAEFRAGAARLGPDEAGTGLTNDKWSLPLLRELGFGLLPTSPAPEVNGRSYAISRFSGPTPIHLVGCGVSLDRRAAGVRGAAAGNPHGLVQEFLNRSDGHLWAIVANGLHLRVLRDSQTLSRQSYLEFDLEAMFAGEVYADFVLLWMLVHATRFAPREQGRPESCWLEDWTKLAEEQGTRALGDLRAGVEKTLLILGQGFVGHPRNTVLREALRSGRLPISEFHGQLLRIVYRLIFLFVAEDRRLEGVPALHPRDDSEAGRLARERYAEHYGTGRLRELAASIRGSRHGDLWQQFNMLTGALAGEERFAAARTQLALPILGGFLWAPTSTADLNGASLSAGEGAELSNADFLEAVRHLAYTRQGKVLRPVDYRNLGSEELGSVYEGLLTLTPLISGDGARFTFAEFAGNARKTSGSYYTPDSLVQCLLDSALDPVVEEAIRGKTGAEAERALLDLKVCDPAAGSGHFLVGVAHRLARHLSRVRALAHGDSEPSPLLYQSALRDVIGRCLYGVDINPMAAELCRVSLWLEALEPGKPLSFLDHHVRVGNSLLGATPDLIAGGIPDEAFESIEGDDRKVCSGLKKRNRSEREGQHDMLHLMVAEPRAEYLTLADQAWAIDRVDDATPGGIQDKQSRFERMLDSEKFRHSKLVADAWCAAFVWRKTADRSLPGCITTDGIRRLGADAGALTQAEAREVERLSGQYRFFHWQLAFPEVFERGGFDVVLGNPPWERVKLQDTEWFAQRSPAIANADNADLRRKLIGALKAEDPTLHQQFTNDSRRAEGESHLLRNSGRYPLCGRGDINLYAVFAEGMRSLIKEAGRVGCVVPIGIATDDGTKFFFRDLVDRGSLHALYMFENEGRLFPGIDHRNKFALLTLSGSAVRAGEADIVFGVNAVAELGERERHYSLSRDDFALLNPDTRTCPVFRWGHDASLAKHIYRHSGFLGAEPHDDEPNWALTIRRLFDMNKRETLALCTRVSPRDRPLGDLVPMYEAKMVLAFDHRFGTYFGQTRAQSNQGKLPELSSGDHLDPLAKATPRFALSPEAVTSALPTAWDRGWLLVWRDITNAVVFRTVNAAIVPRAGTDFTLRVGMPVRDHSERCVLLLASFNSFVFDYCARQKLGGTHLSDYLIRQLPVPSLETFRGGGGWWPSSVPFAQWLMIRVLELTYTAWDLEPFGLDCSWSGPPFRWDEERRFLLRCELDAAFFHLYLPWEVNGDWRQAEDETADDLERLRVSFPTPRDAVAYMMDTFPIVKRRDEEKYGRYRTKDTIMEMYDAMAEAMRTGQPYQTRLDPPPADRRCCHTPRSGGVL